MPDPQKQIVDVTGYGSFEIPVGATQQQIEAAVDNFVAQHQRQQKTLTGGMDALMPTQARGDQGKPPNPIDLAIDNLPELAGFASMPFSGPAAPFAFPAVAELVREYVRGEDVDPLRASGIGVVNALPALASKGGSAVAAYGRDKVGKAIYGGRHIAQDGTPFTEPALDSLTNTAIRENAAMVPNVDPSVWQKARQYLGWNPKAGYNDLLKRSVDLENKALAVQKTNPAAARELTKRMEEIDALIPELKAARIQMRTGRAEEARYLVGGGLVGQAASMTGANKGVSTALSIPAGMITASPKIGLRAGRMLANTGEAGGLTTEALLRALMLAMHPDRQPAP